MGKGYIMFVDERGFLNSERGNNLTMIGVIFEYNYCINSKSIACELKESLNEYKKGIFSKSNIDVPLDDIILKEDVYKNIDVYERNKFVNGLPMLLNSLKFTIISSTIKQEINNLNNSYSILASKLFKKFHSFILRKDGEYGGIIIEAKNEKVSHVMQQDFFNIYNNRNMNLGISNDILNKINTFIICEKNNETYGLGIEVLNLINNVFFRVLNGYAEIDRKLISYAEYGRKNKIYDVIKHKIYKDLEIGISSKQLQKNSYNNIGIINKELLALKEQLKLRDSIINKKEKEINDLSNEIKFLKNRLEEVLFNSQNNDIIKKLLSDIGVKINSFDKAGAVPTIIKR